MSYQKTTLIARRGYSDLGGITAGSAADYCGKKFGVSSKDFQPCVDWYVAGKPGDYQPSSPATASGSGSTLSQVGTFFGNLLGGAVSSYQSGHASSQPVVIPQSTTPSWVVPVAIGGIGLLAFAMLRKRRSAPTSNPARRRRRRRRR